MLFSKSKSVLSPSSVRFFSSTICLSFRFDGYDGPLRSQRHIPLLTFYHTASRREYTAKKLDGTQKQSSSMTLHRYKASHGSITMQNNKITETADSVSAKWNLLQHKPQPFIFSTDFRKRTSARTIESSLLRIYDIRLEILRQAMLQWQWHQCRQRNVSNSIIKSITPRERCMKPKVGMLPLQNLHNHKPHSTERVRVHCHKGLWRICFFPHARLRKWLHVHAWFKHQAELPP